MLFRYWEFFHEDKLPQPLFKGIGTDHCETSKVLVILTKGCCTKLPAIHVQVLVCKTLVCWLN